MSQHLLLHSRTVEFDKMYAIFFYHECADLAAEGQMLAEVWNSGN